MQMQKKMRMRALYSLSLRFIMDVASISVLDCAEITRIVKNVHRTTEVQRVHFQIPLMGKIFKLL
jgi:hypothetical protein